METPKEQLRIRSAMTELIRNLRSVRKEIMTANTFDSAVFNKINGSDASLESLVAHDVYFDAMSAQEQMQLRREILNKLAMEEYSAFCRLRGAISDYLSGIDKALEGYTGVTDRQMKAVEQSKNIKDAVAAALPTATVKGTYSKDDVKVVLDSFSKVDGFLTAVTPLLERVFAETDDTELPPDEDASTAAEPEKVDPNVEEPKPLEHHIISPEPEEGSDADMLNEINAVAGANLSMANCIDKFARGTKTMESLGYSTVKDIVDTLNSIDAPIKSYVAAVQALRDIIPVDTGTSDEMGHGTEQFFATYDSVLDLVGTCENVRAKLDKTVLTLVEALEALEKGF